MKTVSCLLTLTLLFCLVSCTPLRQAKVIEESVVGLVQEEDIFDPAQPEVSTGRWPKDMLPDIIPEYTSGDIVGYSGIQSALSITVTGTTEEDAEVYLHALRERAFAISENKVATKDDIEVSVDFLEASQSVVISVTYTDSEIWPAEMMMDVPALNYGVITYLDTTDPNLIFMQVRDLSPEHAQLWFDQMEAAGFTKTGHGYARSGTDITITDYDQGEWDIQITLQD